MNYKLKNGDKISSASIATVNVTKTNTDLNDYKTDGVFYFDVNFTPKNIPAGSNGWLSVMTGMSGNDKVIKQLWYRHGIANNNDMETYIRTRVNGTEWSQWRKPLFLNNYITGSATMDSSYVNSAELNHYERAGNIVSYSFTIIAKGTWNNTTVFATNLPHAVSNTRFTAMNYSRGTFFRGEIRTDGTIRNAYSSTIPTAGDTLEGQITYIANV